MTKKTQPALETLLRTFAFMIAFSHVHRVCGIRATTPRRCCAYLHMYLDDGNSLVRRTQVRPPAILQFAFHSTQKGEGEGGVHFGDERWSYGNLPFPLTKEELELFDMFRQVVNEEATGTTVRIAGGWVRDKLLGVGGKEDIDVALDNMTGREFALVINKWAKLKGRKVVNVGIIQQNPEKSKHLETATAQLGRFSVDFVNLRTETYSRDSRVPEIKIGTPREDALRRDLTINSLFYNVITGQIEDFTGSGLNDLKLGIVRTPLPALTTLLDDPLRALRAVRFSCRFEFIIAAELLLACKDSSVQELLGAKVSRERINQEVEMMMQHDQSTLAALTLYELGMLPVILSLSNITIEESLSSPMKKGGDYSKSFDPVSFHPFGICILLVSYFLENNLSLQSHHICSASVSTDPCPVSNYHHLNRLLLESIKKYGDSSKIYRLAALTHGASMTNCRHPQKPKKSIPLSEAILLHKLKMRVKDVSEIQTMQQSSLFFANILRNLSVSRAEGLSSEKQFLDSDCTVEIPHYRGVFSRLELGLAMRDAGHLFPYAFLLACSQLLVETIMDNAHIPDKECVQSFENLVDELKDLGGFPNYHKIIEEYQASIPQSSKGNFQGSNNLKDSFVIRQMNAANHAEIQWSVTKEKGKMLSSCSEAVCDILRRCDLLLEAVNALDLNEIWNVQPLLPGSKVKQILTKIPAGSVFGDIMQVEMKWLLCNPKGSTDDLTRYLTKEFKDFQ